MRPAQSRAGARPRISPSLPIAPAGGIRPRSLFFLVPLLCSALCAAFLLVEAQPARADAPQIDHVTFVRDVDPSSARFLEDAIDTAQHDGAALLVITLDTPGGDLQSMKEIVDKELASSVPIAVYVAPGGARAASAGTFVALAAPIVAMAPDTTIGAASPVDGSGGNLPSTLDAKIKHDLDARITAIQQTYGRDATDAQRAVDEAAAFNDTQAIQLHLVDLAAASQADLLQKLDGRAVKLSAGTALTLHLAGLPVRELQPTLANQLETVFFDPTLLFLLFIVAAVCIYLELSHPGAIVPGTVGGIALVLFLFGSQSLSPNWTGLVLMLLGILLLAVDVRTPTHGVLTFGALVCLALGSFIFFDTGVDRGTQLVSPLLIGGLVIGMGIVSLLVLRYAILSQRRQIPGGKEAFIGRTASVIVALEPEGRVRVQGEDWAARLDPVATSAELHVEVGQEVRVLAVEGLKLIVEPVYA